MGLTCSVGSDSFTETLQVTAEEQHTCEPVKDLRHLFKRLEIYSRKLELPREHFMQRWAQ